MDKATTEQKIQEIAQKIVKEFQPEKIILFGSWAWGEPHEWSDVDLFIVKESDKKRWEREYELRRKLIGNKFPPLDLLIYTPREVTQRVTIDDLFVRDVTEHGKILYER